MLSKCRTPVQAPGLVDGFFVLVQVCSHQAVLGLSAVQKMWNASRFCVSSLRRGHANLLCIVPILVYVLPKQVHHGWGLTAAPTTNAG